MREMESRIMQATHELFSSYLDCLLALGVTFEEPELKVWRSDEANYTSEIRILVVKDGEIDDGLEFHVYDKGELVATFEETIDWLKEQLDDLVKTYST